jgi:hypothetical protein
LEDERRILRDVSHIPEAEVDNSDEVS